MKISRMLNGCLIARNPEKCYESYVNVKKLRRSRNILSEAFIPSDHHDVNDVAFGVTKKGIYLDATMIKTDEPINLGSISHSALLYAAGLSKSIDDPKPTDDYVVRGIVKRKLDGDVIFWEDVNELLRKREFVKIAIENLLKNGLIEDVTKIFGANDDEHLALAFDVAQGW
jgi:hypothetical protein